MIGTNQTIENRLWMDRGQREKINKMDNTIQYNIYFFLSGPFIYKRKTMDDGFHHRCMCSLELGTDGLRTNPSALLRISSSLESRSSWAVLKY